jgi:hypothetical protein
MTNLPNKADIFFVGEGEKYHQKGVTIPDWNENNGIN